MLTGYFAVISHAFHPPRVTSAAPVRSTAVSHSPYREDCRDTWDTLTKRTIYGLHARVSRPRNSDGVWWAREACHFRTGRRHRKLLPVFCQRGFRLDARIIQYTFASALAGTATLHTLVDVVEHGAHGKQTSLTTDRVRVLLEDVPSLARVVSENRLWTVRG